MELITISDDRDFSSLRAQWNDLLAQSRQDGPFRFRPSSMTPVSRKTSAHSNPCERMVEARTKRDRAA